MSGKEDAVAKAKWTATVPTELERHLSRSKLLKISGAGLAGAVHLGTAGCGLFQSAGEGQGGTSDVANETRGVKEMTPEEFRKLLRTVADGWNAGDPRLAAGCYAEDAVYLEPPDRQRYVGREALYGFFRGGGPEPRKMSMVWRHVAFDPDAQVGFGEYTFAIPGGFSAHGVAVVAVEDGLISAWREYQYPSELPFADFAGDTLRSTR
jgi:uncharacterized protein (TIGR02246 family)